MILMYSVSPNAKDRFTLTILLLLKVYVCVTKKNDSFAKDYPSHILLV